jgi:hypothetical protein
MTIEEAIKTAIVYEKKVHATYEDRGETGRGCNGEEGVSDPCRGRAGAHHLSRKPVDGMAERWAVVRREVAHHLAVQRTDQGGRQPASFQGYTAQRQPRGGIGLFAPGLGGGGRNLDLLCPHGEGIAGGGQNLFSRFLEIEDGHAAIVQAEMDSVNQSGFWFDLKEFDLEVG